MLEILKDAYLFFRLNFRSICRIVLPILIPQAALSYMIEHHLVTETNSMGLGAVLFCINSLCYAAYTSGLIFFFDDILTGKFTSEKDCLLKGFQVVPVLALTVFVTSVLTGAGMMMLIIPGIIISVRLSLSPFYLLLSGDGPVAAIRNSYLQTKGYAGSIFGSILLGATPLMGILGLYTVTLHRIGERGQMIYPFYDIALELSSAFLLVILFRIYCLINRRKDKEPDNISKNLI